MKLRTKLTLIMLLLLASALSLFSFMSISACRDLLLEDSISYTTTEAGKLLNSAWFLLESNLSHASNSTDIVKRTVMEYNFRRLALENGKTEEYVLQEKDDMIYNNSGIDARTALFQTNRELAALETDNPENDSAEISYMSPQDIRIYSCRISVNQKDYCIAGTVYELDGHKYTISLVHDITRYMNKVHQITLFCILTGTGILLLTALTVISILRHILAPIKCLQKKAADISAGNYHTRITIRKKDELGDLSESFNKMAAAISHHIQEVESQSEQRKMLLSALSHEMRTPVTSITGYSWLLLHSKLTPKQQKDALFYVDAECRRLERLSGKLTQLVSLDYPDSENLHQKCSAEELAETVRRVLTPSTQKYGITMHIEAETGAVFTGDPDLLTMLITNLFDNARKASAGIIVIQMKNHAISVRDNGSGIPGEQLEKVLQPFYQGDSSRNTEGFGLGLALCKKISDLHGGSLYIESEYGIGTAVTLYFTTPEHFSDDLQIPETIQ